MGWFRKDLARIYVEEMCDRIDPTVVPVFPPDTTLDVGDYCSFDDGRLVRRGSVVGRAGLSVTVEEHTVGAHGFSSAGKVSISPSVIVPNPVGGELAQATIDFHKARAVVASFPSGVERRVPDADAFGEALMRLWYAKELNVERVVVWSVRKAPGGTVVVSEKGGNHVEVLVDTALLGAAGLNLAGLSVGVTFGKERHATWKLSTPDVPMVTSVRLLALADDQKRIVDAFGFVNDRDAVAARAAETRPAAVTSADVLSRL